VPPRLSQVFLSKDGEKVPVGDQEVLTGPEHEAALAGVATIVAIEARAIAEARAVLRVFISEVSV
jgi:hypothetical protein